jgi:hypothetical protein
LHHLGTKPLCPGGFRFVSVVPDAVDHFTVGPPGFQLRQNRACLLPRQRVRGRHDRPEGDLPAQRILSACRGYLLQHPLLLFGTSDPARLFC